MVLVMLLFLLVLLAFSLWLRMRRGIANEQMKTSPFSIAMQELVSTAGGVYLSLIMLISFLKLDIPEIVFCGGIRFDPLAGIALILAAVQPLGSLLFYKLTK